MGLIETLEGILEGGPIGVGGLYRGKIGNTIQYLGDGQSLPKLTPPPPDPVSPPAETILPGGILFGFSTILPPSGRPGLRGRPVVDALVALIS